MSSLTGWLRSARSCGLQMSREPNRDHCGDTGADFCQSSLQGGRHVVRLAYILAVGPRGLGLFCKINRIEVAAFEAAPDRISVGIEARRCPRTRAVAAVLFLAEGRVALPCGAVRLQDRGADVMKRPRTVIIIGIVDLDAASRSLRAGPSQHKHSGSFFARTFSARRGLVGQKFALSSRRAHRLPAWDSTTPAQGLPPGV